MRYRLLFPCGAMLPREGTLERPPTDGRVSVWSNQPKDAHADIPEKHQGPCDRPIREDGETQTCVYGCEHDESELHRCRSDDGRPYMVATCVPEVVEVPEQAEGPVHFDGPCPFLTCLETGPHDHPVCPDCGAVDFGNFSCSTCQQNNRTAERIERYKREGRYQ